MGFRFIRILLGEGEWFLSLGLYRIWILDNGGHFSLQLLADLVFARVAFSPSAWFRLGARADALLWTLFLRVDDRSSKMKRGYKLRILSMDEREERGREGRAPSSLASPSFVLSYFLIPPFSFFLLVGFIFSFSPNSWMLVLGAATSTVGSSLFRSGERTFWNGYCCRINLYKSVWLNKIETSGFLLYLGLAVIGCCFLTLRVSEEFVAHSSNVNCLKIGKKSSRVVVTGGEDHKVNLWAIGKPNSILVGSNPSSSYVFLVTFLLVICSVSTLSPPAGTLMFPDLIMIWEFLYYEFSFVVFSHSILWALKRHKLSGNFGSVCL